MQKILNKEITKIIIALSLSLGVFLCGFIEAFADDLSELPSGSSDPEGSSDIVSDVTIPDEALEAASEEILSILQNNSLTAANAVEYTTTDIYYLLQRLLAGGSTSNSLVASLPLIQKYLLTIANAMTDNNVNAAPTNGNTVYALLSDVHSILYSLESQYHLNQLSDLTNYLNYSMYDYLILLCEATSEINNYLPNLIPIDYSTSLTNIRNAINSVVSNINTSNSYLLSIDNSFDTLLAYSNKYHWSNYINNETPYFVGYTTDFNDILTIQSGSPYTIQENVFAWFSGFPIDWNNSYIYHVNIPIQKLATSNYIYTPNIDFYIRYNNNSIKVKNVDYITIPNRLGLDIYFNSPVFSSYDEFAIQFIYEPTTSFSITNFSPTFEFLKSNTPEYFEFYDRFLNKNNFDNINKLTNLYASDDLIAAKEAQKPYETQAIEDFTGSGSAASSTSDLGNLKNTSGAFKNGLSTSRSASDALSVFSSASELWSWFSNNTLNDLDHTSQNRNLLKSSNSDDQIIDFYNMNNNGLIDWMHQ